MKKIIALTTALMLAGSMSAYAADVTTQPAATTVDKPQADAKVDMSKVSYIIGYEMGKGFKTQNIDLNVSELNKGINAGLQGKDSAISQEDSKAIMQAFQQEMIKKAQEKLKAASTENLKSSDAFMSAIAKEKGIQKAADGVYFQVLKKGDGKAPAKTDTVTVDYTGTTPAKVFSSDKDAQAKLAKGELLGKVFDSSEKTGKPATFPLNQVIPCWTDALSQVPVGSEVILYCAPKTAYGEMAPPQIGPNQVLSFKVKLISAKAAEKPAATDNAHHSAKASDATAQTTAKAAS